MAEENILWSLRPSQLTFVAELIGGSSDSAWVRKTLRPLLSHESAVVREGAIYGLERHLDSEGLRNMLAAMSASDPSAGVRLAAEEALEIEPPTKAAQ